MSDRAAVKTENQTTHFSDVVKIKAVQTITTIVSVLFVSSIPVSSIYLPYKRKNIPPKEWFYTSEDATVGNSREEPP